MNLPSCSSVPHIHHFNTNISSSFSFVSCFFSLPWLLSHLVYFHRFIEWPELKSTTMIIELQPPCCVQGCQSLDQATQSHIQPGLARFQGWGIHTWATRFSMSPPSVKDFLLISNLKLSCLNLKPFHLVLSLSTLINSHSPSCLYPPFKYWKAVMRSPWSLLFSRLKKPSFLSPSAEDPALLSGPALDPLQHSL